MTVKLTLVQHYSGQCGGNETMGADHFFTLTTCIQGE